MDSPNTLIIRDLLLQLHDPRYWELNWLGVTATARAIFLGYRKGGYPCSRYNNLSKKVFPDKPRGAKLKVYLLACFELKHCGGCDTILPFSAFRKNSNNERSNNLNSQCKDCHSEASATTQRARTAKYRATKIGATPGWASIEDISLFYNETPEGCHVDHIVPLQGKNVCGLHTLENLQYLLAEENLAKGNRY